MTEINQTEASIAKEHDVDHHPAHLGHHWDTEEQQFHAGKFGMWLFLTTEILLFGGLFVAYAVWRSNHPEIFKYGSEFLDTKMGAINTAVLLLSSMTMALGVTFSQKGKTKELAICLVLTLMGAFGFLIIKYFEYSHKIHEGLLPGIYFYEEPSHSYVWVDKNNLEGNTENTSTNNLSSNPSVESNVESFQERIAIPSPPLDAEESSVMSGAIAPEGTTDLITLVDDESMMSSFLMLKNNKEDDVVQEKSKSHVHPLQDPERPIHIQKFFTIYFLMTGLHGIHVIIGGGVIVWLLVLTLKGRFSSQYFTPIDLGGLYWHIVDLIWIFLFPLFYLI